jgi:superfamily I DNA/RNA helicase
MLYMPVMYGIAFNHYNYIFVDEAQDTNDIQLEILSRLCAPRCRIVAVGDPHQAIYGFRGANADSMTRITERFSCKTFPLSVSYRCPKAVVKEAQRYLQPIEQTKMPDEPNTNIDEIEPNDNGGDTETVECEDSPTGRHEFDTDESTGEERCVYCEKEKGED